MVVLTQVKHEDIERVLQEYIETIVPAMFEQRYHLILVKGGPDYPHLSEQSHFAHIINGVFGLAALIRFLVEQKVPVVGLNADVLRQALALYTIHEVHKAEDYDKLDDTEFSIPLDRLRQEYKKLGLDKFAVVDEHLMRFANVHQRSPRHGDGLLAGDNSLLLWVLVRIADTLASMTTPTEYGTLSNYLKRLGPAFAPRTPLGQFRLYYHELKDIRGMLTNTIHEAVSLQLQKAYGFYPLLYFATGTLYLGPATVDGFDSEDFIQAVVTYTLNALGKFSGSADAIRDGLRRQKYDFETFVYAFAGIESLLEVVREDTQLAKPDARLPFKEIDGLANKRADLPPDWRDTVEVRFGIALSDPDKTFNEQWSLVRRYLLYVDTLLRDLNPSEERLEWFIRTFEVPEEVSEHLRAESDIWARGGIGKYVLIIAYHFLRGPDFADRKAETLTLGEVLERLHIRVLHAMRQSDTRSGRQAAVKSLGFRQDLTTYLQSHLHLSFHLSITLQEDILPIYSAPKRKGHSNAMCSLCNRQSKYIKELRTGILDDFGRVFSNRVLPAIEVPGKNRPWCPLCHLEFIFRKLSGLGLPSGAHYKNSYRIYLYVLPTFSFTPEHTRLFQRFLGQFNRVSGLPIRDFGQQWGLPHYWLLNQEFDPDWTEELNTVLEREAERIASRGGLGYVGERVLSRQVSERPHYYLIIWEKPARETESDDARVATRTEAWAKALFAASIISAQTACKVYVTERPYLPISDPVELKPTIMLDSLPPALRGLVGEQADAITLYGREKGGRSGLEQVLDMSAALWTVTSEVHAPNRPTKDKHISARLGLLNVEPLSGARFYKEYSRLNDGTTPFSPLDRACEVILEVKGGEFVDLIEEIGKKMLDIRLPFRSYGRGKIHNYELTFREAVDALRKGFALVPELRESALTGKLPSEKAIAELKKLASGRLLKSMERRSITRRGEGVINPWRQDLSQLTWDLIDILVDEVYLHRAGGSFARFLSLENSLADGVYYYTDRNLSALWKQYQKQKEAQS